MTNKTFHLESTLRAKGYWEIIVSFAWIALFFFLQTIWVLGSLYWFGLMDLPQDQLENPGLISSDRREIYALSVFYGIVGSGLNFILFVGTYLVFFGRAKLLGITSWGQNINLRLIGYCIAILFCAYLLQYAWILSFPDVEMQKTMRDLIDAVPDTPEGQIVLFLAIAVMAGITEEIIFRGFLQTAIARYVNIYVAIIISAAIFGLVHGQVESLPPLIALGAAYGLIYHLTKSLRITMLLHVLNNGFAIAFPKFAQWLIDNGYASQPETVMIMQQLFL